MTTNVHVRGYTLWYTPKHFTWRGSPHPLHIQFVSPPHCLHPHAHPMAVHRHLRHASNWPLNIRKHGLDGEQLTLTKCQAGLAHAKHI